jgi:hypothetical protein
MATIERLDKNLYITLVNQRLIFWFEREFLEQSNGMFSINEGFCAWKASGISAYLVSAFFTSQVFSDRFSWGMDR